MGRSQPSRGIQPASVRKDARAKKARATINKEIPALLQAYPRARNGVSASELISNPSKTLSEEATSATTTEAKSTGSTTPIRIQVADTLQAAAFVHEEVRSHKSKGRIGILNMASPLRPGGGFLTGATSQEESLCMRTTLYPALREEFYRLPEIGGVYTSDVLVFRSGDEEATDLKKSDRFFVDVISSGMLRFPDLSESDDGQPDKTYANTKDRKLVQEKMKAVLSICRLKKVSKIVLGAWGCGAYGNPVGEVAQVWKKELQENREGIEVIFAIKDKSMAEQFASILDVEVENLEVSKPVMQDEEEASQEVTELQDKINELRVQVSRTRNSDLRQRLQSTLGSLEAQLPGPKVLDKELREGDGT